MGMSDEALVTASGVAKLAGVGRAAVSNWRRRHGDFPEPVGGSGASPAFRLAEVEQWLRRQGKLAGSPSADILWRALDADRGEASATGLVAEIAAHFGGATSSGPSEKARDILDELGDEPRAELLDDLVARLFERQQRQHLMTPPELAELMVRLAEPVTGTVFDPSCGPGNLLRVAAERGARVLAGQEIDPELAHLANARLRLSAAATIAAGDALRADAYPDLRADIVLCDPPFGYRDWGHEDLAIDPRWAYGFPVKAEPELAWLQHCLSHTKPGGTVVIAMPAGVASRRSGRSIRQALLRGGAVRAVFALPPGVLMSTGIPIHLWVLRNPEGPGADPILLVDAGRHRPERRGRADWPALSAAVLTPWRQFPRAGAVEAIAGQQCIIEPIELLDEDVDLTPHRHLPLPAQPLDADALRADCAELAHQLGELAVRLPQPIAGGTDRARPRTTISDLARAGALTVRQHMGHLDTTDDPDADGPLVLSGRDVATGGAPFMRLVSDPTPDLIELRPGDVVAPSVLAGSGRCVAEVVQSDGMILGPNVMLIQVDRQRLDPHYLAGQLRASRSSRASTQTASGAHRLDIRRVEIPVLDIDEQRRLGEKFRRLREFENGLREVADRGVRLARTVTDGLAEGDLDFHLVTKRSQHETR